MDRDLMARLLTTPFVSSFVGRARAGDLHDADHGRRAAAWAQWTVESLTEMVGLYDRSYAALVLPGRFYDPKGTGPKVRPHLEVSHRVLERSDPEFPDRLALAGNGLLFEWWVFSEVKAARRALFVTRYGTLTDAVETLVPRRPGLVDAVNHLNAVASPRWQTIEKLLVSEPDGLSDEATRDFTTAEVAEFFPAAAELELEVAYDEKLRETNGVWASRRIGVWQIRGVNTDGKRFSFGVITPRLTTGSLFRDPQFRPETEGVGALLVRGLLLRRLVNRHLVPGSDATRVGDPSPDPNAAGRPFLRAVVARVGAKIPEASTEAAVHFLHTYPDADDAWRALRTWASPSYLLTVTEDGFKASHANAYRFIRRAEDPERDDINVILPLAWDDRSRVVRVSFSRPPSDEE